MNSTPISSIIIQIIRFDIFKQYNLIPVEFYSLFFTVGWFYKNQIPWDCYLYTEYRRHYIPMHVPLLYNTCNDCRIKTIWISNPRKNITQHQLTKFERMMTKYLFCYVSYREIRVHLNNTQCRNPMFSTRSLKGVPTTTITKTFYYPRLCPPW